MRPLDRVDALFGAAAGAAVVFLVALGAGLTFFADEWAFIESRSLGDPSTWLAPHNEHWVTVPVLVYRGVVETVGLSSYLPFQVILIACHVAVAALVYVLIRRSAGRWLALAAGLVTLVLGSGFENLYWAFQITFVGALALGLGAVLVFDVELLTRRRATIGTALLLGAVATSGIGVVCAILISVELMLQPTRRRALPWVGIPLVIYGGWYLAIGRAAIESHQGLFGLGRPDEVALIVVHGLAAAAGAMTGVGTSFGLAVVAVAAIATALSSVRRRRFVMSARMTGSVVAVFVLYGLIGLTRSFVGPQVADLTRYSYISAILLAVGISTQIGHPRWSRVAERRAWLLGGGLVFTLALLWNTRLLVAGRALFEDRAERTRALVTVALERPLPASTDPDRSLVLVPSPNALLRIVDRYGSPLADSMVPWAVEPISPVALADARRTLSEGAEVPLPDPREP